MYQFNTTSSSASIISPSITGQKNSSCFKFSYYFDAQHSSTNTLSLVFLNQNSKAQVLWQTFASNIDDWVLFELDIPQSASYKVCDNSFVKMLIFCSFQLSFQANSSYGYVALKNFRLSSTPCMLSSDCTFEQGPCGWSDASNNYGFTLTQADATNSALKRDHTLNTGSGHVMYLPPGNDSILTAYISNNVYGKQVQLVPRAYFKVLNTVENSIVCV